MLFKEFEPQKDKLFRVMDNDGKIIASKWKPDITAEFVLECYKFMHFARLADLMAVSFQRQGRMYTYPPNLGQEAITTAVGKQMRGQDWLVSAFREMSAWLLKGAKLSDIFLYWGGYEDGSKFSGAPNILPVSVPIASQLIHAVGLGYAIKYRKEDGVVFAFVGDGGTSQGDFHEALNFAAVWNVPVIFIIQNNQYAISVPVKMQTVSRNLAIKAIAYGIPGIKVDGNDFFALYKTIEEALGHVKAGKGPVLVEALTYRRGAHTTSDDPTLYRTEKEEKEWEEKDPIKRLRGYLVANGTWKEKDDEALLEQYKKEVEKEFAVYENQPPYPVDDVFKYQFKDLPEDLRQQQVAYEKFLQWQEAQK
jgi:pyruvate dehydrogenase E1 component alpha subunit